MKKLSQTCKWNTADELMFIKKDVNTFDSLQGYKKGVRLRTNWDDIKKKRIYEFLGMKE